MAVKRRKRQPQAMGAVLLQALERVRAEAPPGLLELSCQWVTVVGPSMARQTWPEALKGDELVVATTHPAWRQEIHLRQEALLARMALVLGKHSVRRLSSVLRPGAALEPPAAPLLPGAAARSLAAAVSQDVADPGLREAIFRAAALQLEARARRERR